MLGSFIILGENFFQNVLFVFKITKMNLNLASEWEIQKNSDS